MVRTIDWSNEYFLSSSLKVSKEVLHFLLWLDEVNGFLYIETIAKELNEIEISFSDKFTVIISTSYYIRGITRIGSAQFLVRRASSFQEVCHLLLTEIIVA